MLTDGIVAPDKKYDFSSEKNLLGNMPKYSGQTLDVCYCINRAYLGDFDYVRSFRLNMTEDDNGSDYQRRIDKIIEHFGIEMQSNLVGRGN